MKINQNDQLDASIFLASNACVHDLISEFEKLNELTPDDKLHKRSMRTVKSDIWKRRIRKVCRISKILAVAVIATISILTTAFISVPEIRQATWKAIVTYLSGDESFKIDFESQNQDDSATSTLKMLEEIHAPQYMPQGYTATVNNQLAMYVQVYSNQSDGSQYIFTQSIHECDRWVNAKTGMTTEMTVNGWTAVLVAYDNSPCVTLFWHDSQYCYTLSGQFENTEQLLRIANSVETQ